MLSHMLLSTNKWSIIQIKYLQILEIIQKPLTDRTLDDEEILNTCKDTVQKISQRYFKFIFILFNIYMNVQILRSKYILVFNKKLFRIY